MAKARTKDEMFIICAYETATKGGDIHMTLDRYEIGNRCGISPKGVNAICNLLMRCNFIMLKEETGMYLTKHGEKLALRLLEE
ncbi:MAG: hypothetical protein H0X51_06740 [Parachlamydiaceae bacterium]|nr:hypothetical protein [Parachlamydiaceae bacterium]